jgi:prepilin-type N-terminal cleavage/methylation domain-containing protein
MINEKGFTIIEVVIVIAISLVLLIGLLNLFEWHQKVYVLEEATVRTTSDARNTMLSMSEYIAQSSNVLPSHSFNSILYTTSGNTVVLEVPSVNSSDNVIPFTFDYVAFYLQNGSVYQIVEVGTGSVRPAGTKRLAENVQTFTLTYNSGTPSQSSTVNIDLRTLIPTRNGNVDTRVTDTIFLRNKQ